MPPVYSSSSYSQVSFPDFHHQNIIKVGEDLEENDKNSWSPKDLIFEDIPSPSKK